MAKFAVILHYDVEGDITPTEALSAVKTFVEKYTQIPEESSVITRGFGDQRSDVKVIVRSRDIEVITVQERIQVKDGN